MAPGRVGEPHDPLERPAGQQAVAERAAERVAGAEPVDDRRPGPAAPRRRSSSGHGQHALGSLLDDGELDAAVEQRLGRGVRIVARRPRSRTPRGCRRRR